MAIYCHDLDTLLPVYLDGELQGHELGDLEHHLGTCEACRARSEREADEHERMRAMLRGPAAPARLRAGLLAMLDREDRSAAAPRRRAALAWALPGSASLAAAAALALFVADSLRSPVVAEGPHLDVAAVQYGAVANRMSRAPLVPVSSPRDLSRSLPEYLRVPVTAPTLRGGNMRGWQPTQLAGRVAAKLVYEVKLQEGRSFLVDVHLLDGRDMAADRDSRLVNGTAVWLGTTAGINTVALRDGRGIGYVFSSDMATGQLLDVVLKSELLHKVNDRVFGN